MTEIPVEEEGQSLIKQRETKKRSRREILDPNNAERNSEGSELMTLKQKLQRKILDDYSTGNPECLEVIRDLNNFCESLLGSAGFSVGSRENLNDALPRSLKSDPCTVEKNPKSASSKKEVAEDRTRTDTPKKKEQYVIRRSKLLIGGVEAEENRFVEFKLYKGPVFSDPQWDEIIKTICGFVNGEGGRIFIGVDDGGFVLGTEMGKKGYDEFKCKLTTQIISRISPKLDNSHYSIESTPVYLHQEDWLNEGDRYKLLLIEIAVEKGQFVYFATRNQEQICFQRFDASTRGLRGDQINQLMMARLKNSPSA